MAEETYRRISVQLQKIGMAGAVLGAGFALWQYHDSSQKQFQAPLWQKQVELYTAATDTLARLAYAKDEKEWNDAQLRFWELYGGSLILVEDDEVAQGMIDFSKEVRAVGDNPVKRGEDFEKDAILLSYKFRASIEKSVGSSLPALKTKKTETETNAPIVKKP